MAESPTKRQKPSGFVCRPRAETDPVLGRFSDQVGAGKSTPIGDIAPKVVGTDILFGDQGLVAKFSAQAVCAFPPDLEVASAGQNDTYDMVCDVPDATFEEWKELYHVKTAKAIIDAARAGKLSELKTAKSGMNPVLNRKVAQTVDDMVKDKKIKEEQVRDYLVSCFEDPKGKRVAFSPVKEKENDDGTKRRYIQVKHRFFKKMVSGKTALTPEFIGSLPQPLQLLAAKVVGDKLDQFYYNDLKTFDANGDRVNFTALPNRKGRIGLNGAVIFVYVKGMLQGKQPFSLVSPQEVHVLACQEGENVEETALGSNSLFA